MLIRRILSGLLLLLWLGMSSRPAVSDETPYVRQNSAPIQAGQPIFSEGIRGTLILVGGGDIPEAAALRFIRLIPAEGTVVILAAAADQPAIASQRACEWLESLNVPRCVVPPTAPGTVDHLQELAGLLEAAAGVWICGGQQSRLAAAYQGTIVEEQLMALRDRGGVIGGTSAGAAIMTQIMIASGSDQPVISRGFSLLPDAIVDQHFTERKRIGRSRLALQEHPDRFGIGLDEGTALICSGRAMEVRGRGHVTVLLPESADAGAAAGELLLKDGDQADLVQLRRSVRSRRNAATVPAETSSAPQVTSGSLVIVGGGKMPDAIVDRFVDLAGGADAHLVVLPTAVPRRDAFREPIPGFLQRQNVASVTMLPHSYPQEIASDEFQQALRRATGVWFGGGRQWNFVDAYEGTSAVELFRNVLQRGGVIGGSSAGATIQGEFLVRGHPLGNTIMMAEGYEQGFSFLPGTAIDQHFSQRGRKPDLIPVIRRHPHLLGIGIDESTALVVRGSKAEVVGEHSAWFLPARQLQALAAEPTAGLDAETLDEVYLKAPAGSVVDLSTLQIAEPKRP